MTVQHKFVQFMPDVIDDGIIYISMEYGAVIHNCPCGCGNQVDTPLSPAGWRLIYDGRNVSLKPSVGNWSLNCKSHYWIKNGEIKWALTWSDDVIDKVREAEILRRQELFDTNDSKPFDLDMNNKPNTKTKFVKIRKWFLTYFLGK